MPETHSLVGMAKNVAISLCRAQGNVTAPRLSAELEKLRVDVGGHDPRWMGQVFRDTSLFEKTGEYVNEGSHCRAVPVWVLKNAAVAEMKRAV